MYFASEIVRIAVVDTTVTDNGLNQPKSVKTCKYHYVHFCQNMTRLSNYYEKMHDFFDRCDMEILLKAETRTAADITGSMSGKVNIMLEGFQ